MAQQCGRMTQASQTKICNEDFSHRVPGAVCPACGVESPDPILEQNNKWSFDGGAQWCQVSCDRLKKCRVCPTVAGGAPRCGHWVQQCFQPLDVLYRIAGALLSFSIFPLLQCWIDHTPGFSEHIFIWISTLALIVLNTVEWSVIMAPASRNAIIALFSICYAAMFAYFVWALWGIIVAPWISSSTIPDNIKTAEQLAEFKTRQDLLCQRQCCAIENGYNALALLATASILRFSHLLVALFGSGHLFSSNAVSYSPLNTMTQMSHCATIMYSITAVLFCVLSVTIQLFITNSQLGTPRAFLIPLAYLATLPLGVLCRLRSYVLRGANSLWVAWSLFFPAFTAVACIAWPITLLRKGFINQLQMELGVLSCFLLILGGNMFQSILERNATLQR